MSATATINANAVLLPDPATQQQALDVEAFLEFLLQSDGKAVARLVASNGNAVDVPPQMYGLLLQVARVLAQGDGISVHAVSRELTTSEAAKLLGMSRPSLIRLLETDQIPSHRVGTHRRIRLADVVEFRRQRLQQQRRAYEELMRECDSLGMDE